MLDVRREVLRLPAARWVGKRERAALRTDSLSLLLLTHRAATPQPKHRNTELRGSMVSLESPPMVILCVLLTQSRPTAFRPAGTSRIAIDSKPPHGSSPYGHVANSSCPNHLQAFGGFVQILHIQIFFTEGNEGNEGASHGAFAFYFRIRPHKVTDWWNQPSDGKPDSSWLVW